MILGGEQDCEKEGHSLIIPACMILSRSSGLYFFFGTTLGNVSTQRAPASITRAIAAIGFGTLPGVVRVEYGYWI